MPSRPAGRGRAKPGRRRRCRLTAPRLYSSPQHLSSGIMPTLVSESGGRVSLPFTRALARMSRTGVGDTFAALLAAIVMVTAAAASKEPKCMLHGATLEGWPSEVAEFRHGVEGALATLPSLDEKSRRLAETMVVFTEKLRKAVREMTALTAAADDADATLDDRKKWLLEGASKRGEVLAYSLMGESLVQLAADLGANLPQEPDPLIRGRYGCTPAETARFEAEVLTRLADLRRRDSAPSP